MTPSAAQGSGSAGAGSSSADTRRRPQPLPHDSPERWRKLAGHIIVGGQPIKVVPPATVAGRREIVSVAENDVSRKRQNEPVR